MKEIFEKYGIEISVEQFDKFEKYYNLLIEFNQKFNITAITEKKEVYIKHFIDSLLCIKKIGCGKLIDIGSGGGFPALPIKIMRDDLNVTLLEATGKKCIFLQTVIKELGLKNMIVINGRAEDFAKKSNFREVFDICTARAVARLNTLCEYTLPFVKVGGTFIAFKGEVNEELKEGENSIKILGGKCEFVDNLNLEDAKRDIVFIKKVKTTPEKYPRGNGKERKNPL